MARPADGEHSEGRNDEGPVFQFRDEPDAGPRNTLGWSYRPRITRALIHNVANAPLPQASETVPEY
jgi:hypothetical protein